MANTAMACQEKVLICGICKNTEDAVALTIDSIEELGRHFEDYAVIIYENNSSDNTAALYQKWAEQNHRVHFVSAFFREDQLLHSRTENIARARNEVLALARDSQYADFKYLIMADCDFSAAPWPVTEILEAVALPVEWDCICANGVNSDAVFLDLYSFRDARYPFGSEVMGDASWWDRLEEMRFTLDGDRLLPVYSAFGGLAIYKRASVIPFSYSGVVTEDLRQYYRQILLCTSQEHHQVQEYLHSIDLLKDAELSSVPIVFQKNTIWEHAGHPHLQTCCEHVTLHASMAVHGFGKIFVYPKMRMYY